MLIYQTQLAQGIFIRQRNVMIEDMTLEKYYNNVGDFTGLTLYD